MDPTRKECLLENVMAKFFTSSSSFVAVVVFDDVDDAASQLKKSIAARWLKSTLSPSSSASSLQ